MLREVYAHRAKWQALRIGQAAIDRRQLSIGRLVETGKELFRVDFTVDEGLEMGSRPKSSFAGTVHRRTCGMCSAGNLVDPTPLAVRPVITWAGLGGGGGKIDTVFLLGDGERPSSALPRNPKRCRGGTFKRSAKK